MATLLRITKVIPHTVRNNALQSNNSINDRRKRKSSSNKDRK
jgi:hypothetical protein